MDQKLSKAEERKLEEEILQNERKSVLSLLDVKNTASNRKTILHRLIIVGKLSSKFDDKSKFGEYYDKMFKNQQKAELNQKHPNPFHEKVTGILIIYPTLFFHVIESSLETIKEILKDVEQMKDDENGMVNDSKILSVAHEIHVRLFPVYTFKMMNLNLEHDSNEPSETIEQLVQEIVTRLLRLGKFLTDNSKNQFKKDIVDNLHDQHPEFLPNQNSANYLLKCNDLQTPFEYLENYRKPFKITFESELTWPAPVKLFPYQ